MHAAALAALRSRMRMREVRDQARAFQVQPGDVVLLDDQALRELELALATAQATLALQHEVASELRAHLASRAQESGGQPRSPDRILMRAAS